MSKRFKFKERSEFTQQSISQEIQKPELTKKATLLSNIKPKLKVGALCFLLGFLLSSFISISFIDISASTNEEISNSKARTSKKNHLNHKLAVVVPFRDRFNELSVFVPHISQFLNLKSIDFKIFIVNQIDKYRFNRAALINVGFLASMNECDYMVMHDVDLLPLNDQLAYTYPNDGPFHVSSPGLHPEYNYNTFIGGVLIVTKEHFIKTNGMSNRYWGWGKEDDELYLRFKEANLTIQRPNITQFKTGQKYTFFHNHDSILRPRDRKRFLKQKNESLKYDMTGLNYMQYKIKRDYLLTFEEQFTCSVIDVELFCDKVDTHWCNTDYQFLD